MRSFEVEVRVTPREGLLDPQGNAVAHALQSLEFDGVDTVKVGKLIRIRLDAEDTDDAAAVAEAMCRKLLANPVTEDFDIGVRPLAGADA
jgi:phosphoribosylformylglycinamidine synthase